MASVTADGTQVFGIPDSPVMVGLITYIAEDITITGGSNRPEIKDANGVPIGQQIVPQVRTGTAKLQLAASTTAIPTRGATLTMTALGAAGTWLITEVGSAYTQGEYAKVNIAFAEKINT